MKECNRCGKNMAMVRIPGTQQWWCGECIVVLQNDQELQMSLIRNNPLLEDAS